MKNSTHSAAEFLHIDVEEYVYEDLQTMIKELHSYIPQLSHFEVADVQNMRFEPMYDKVKDFALQAYRDHETEIINFYNDVISKYEPDFIPQEPFSSENVMRDLEKDILLRVVDNKWIDHLHNIDMLRRHRAACIRPERPSD